ncbi:MAG TPA: nucleotidyltransferase domain-containing protein [Aggregatilineales bacterium]|nr:nucleotidyltransferase domain-containing protein [Aggregatilineales bacterium]
MTDNKRAPWTLEDLRAYREQILALAEQYGAYDVRVFGSVARGEAEANSDVDFMVKFRSGASLWDAVGLWQDLQALLGCKVSLVSEDDRQARERFMRRARQDEVML